jgi:vancomycin resistance protein YoaR
MVGKPLVLQYQGIHWEVAPDVLRGMLKINSESGKSRSMVTLDGEALTSYQGTIADQIQAKPRNANVVWSWGEFVVRPSAPGVALDAAATSSVVIRALADGRHTVDV